MSRSGSAGGAEGRNPEQQQQPSCQPPLIPNLLPAASTHTHKYKLPRGLPPAAHQGGLFKTASLRDSTDETLKYEHIFLTFFC